MIAGVGPVLGEGPSGFFIDPGGPIGDFEYRAAGRRALSDGARLTLATTVVADRTRTAYGGQLQPDELVPEVDRVVPRAVEWLQTGK